MLDFGTLNLVLWGKMILYNRLIDGTALSYNHYLMESFYLLAVCQVVFPNLSDLLLLVILSLDL